MSKKCKPTKTYPVFVAHFTDGTVTRMACSLSEERALEQARAAYRVRAQANNTWHPDKDPMPGKPPEIEAWGWEA